MYSVSVIRKKAHDIGFHVTKGFQHFGRSVFHDSYGERHSGYMVLDMDTGLCGGGNSEDFDFLWDLGDVVDFLKGQYETRGLVW